jgi:hypothetical protein
MNLLKLQGRGRGPMSGDVFELIPGDDHRVLGLVIAAKLAGPTDAPMPGSNLIYLFDPKRSSQSIPDDRVEPDELLLPPLFVNQRPWTHGYFRKVGVVEQPQSRALRSHCFWDAARGRYVDGNQQPLAIPTEPCGSWQLITTEWIDDHVSDALGIERDRVGT